MTSRPLSLLLIIVLLASSAPVAGLCAESSRSEEAAPPRPEVVSELPVQGRANYVLQPQDVLKVFVFQHEDLNKQTEAVQVSPEHTISLPLVGVIALRDKTARQAEQIIREAYDRDFLVNPQVSVIVVKYSERSVNVLGQVGKPDRIPFPQEKGLTIIEAIALAGGPTRLADLRRVKLTRKLEDGTSLVEEIDVSAMMIKGGRGAVQLRTGDVIYVPERIL
ncbi:MAG: polysaccharide biosynthesis/export family protein [Opitutaceae bacterium]